MAKKTWLGGATAVAQVKTFTITAASTLTTAVWTLTLTGEDGSTATETYTEDGSPTTSEISAGLVSAVNSSTKPLFQAVTAADGAGSFTLTADTAGVPFSASLADNSDGTHTEADTTDNEGPNDYNTLANWLEGAVPAANDDVRITGSNSILYGLDQSSVELDDFIVADFSGEIGSEGAKLQIDMADADRFEFDATGQAYIDVGSAAITAVIQRTKSQSKRQAGLHLTGSAIATLRVEGGSVLLDGATVTLVIVEAGAKVVIPPGNTVTTLNSDGAGCYLEVAATTVTVGGGSLTINGSGAITTLDVNDGSVESNTSGTIATVNADGGSVDFSESNVARTVTTLNARGGTAIYDPNVLTITNAIASPGPIEVTAA